MTLRNYLYILTLLLLTSCNLTSSIEYLRQGDEIGIKGDYKAAIALYDKAILKNPNFKEAYIQRGLCYENLHNVNQAINDYETLLSLDTNNTTAYYYIGLCKFEQKKYNEAIDYYNRALMTKGISNPTDTGYQAIIEFNKNGIFKDKFTFDIPAREIYFERGLAYYSTHQYKKAFHDFQNSIEMKYNVGESHYMTGLCWLSIAKKEKACESFKLGFLYGDSLSTKTMNEICK